MTGFENRNALGDEYDPDDDEPGSHEVPVDLECWQCGRQYRGLAGEDDRWCSTACCLRWCHPEVPPGTADGQANDGEEIPF